MSYDAARTSSMGGKGRKDTRPIGDPAFKSRCIDKIMDFIEKNRYEYGIHRRTLLTPSTKDFVNIFNVSDGIFLQVWVCNVICMYVQKYVAGRVCSDRKRHVGVGHS